ncbi:MAG: hypothetical protein R2739_03930 [Chitinophagales bacterium]|nr:hypothetical protein [Bacteroidota bacterium]
MQIQQDNDSLIISIPNNIDAFGKQKLIEYAKYLELTAGKKIKQEEADKLAEEMKSSWWKKNKMRFVKA